MLSLNCKHVQHVKIYLPHFEVNPITHFVVIALFSSKVQNFYTFILYISKTIRDRGKV